jgi:hypothetical protein
MVVANEKRLPPNGGHCYGWNHMCHDRTVMTAIFSKNGVSLERLQTLAKVGAGRQHRVGGQGRSEHAKPDQPAPAALRLAIG